MKIEDLKRKLERSQIPEDAYCLQRGLPNEAYCIEGSKGIWQTFYSERGSRTGLNEFDSEDEACDYFWSIMLRQFPDKAQ